MKRPTSLLSCALALGALAALTHCGRDTGHDLTNVPDTDAGHETGSGASATAASTGSAATTTGGASSGETSTRGATGAAGSNGAAGTSTGAATNSTAAAVAASTATATASSASSSSGTGTTSSGELHSATSSSGAAGSSGTTGAIEDFFPDGGIADAGDGLGPIPPRGGVTLDGGTVDRLFFTFTGDTRPPICDVFFIGGYDYPSAQVTEVAQQMEAQQPQFALDLGDHEFVCFGGSSEANQQISAYMTAISNFHAPFFMTMGNHECIFALGGSLDDCGANNTSDPAFTAWMSALAPISSTPYYYRDIQTSMGLARFIFVADDAWDDTEATWFNDVLTEADSIATYTIVANHHNLAASTSGNYEAEVQTLDAHKFALHLTAHTHTYTHDTANDPTGRTVIVGVGGASDATAPALGYATVIQGLDGRLYFTMYDSSTNLPMDAWSVGPNQ